MRLAADHSVFFQIIRDQLQTRRAIGIRQPYTDPLRQFQQLGGLETGLVQLGLDVGASGGVFRYTRFARRCRERPDMPAK